MRIWHPHLIELLDDNRLPSCWHDINAVLRVLDGALTTSRLWATKEVQAWHGLEAELAWLGNLVRDELGRRGTFVRLLTGTKQFDLNEWSGIPQARYLESTIAWYRSDVSALFLKWSQEGRFNVLGHEEWRGFPYLGRRWKGGFEAPLRQFTSTELQPLHATKMKELFLVQHHESWTREQQAAVEALAKLRAK